MNTLKAGRLRKLDSIWTFPIIITIVFLSLVALRINGSSVGIYNAYFNGTPKDAKRLTGQTRTVRTDEWLVNTQMVLAQKNNHFQKINENIGNGQDMSLIIDVPYKEWSQLFRPQNISFFVMPFEFAFAFKWWVMSYLLLLSCYFFIVSLLPRRKLLASILSVALLASAFIQWWYQYITLAPDLITVCLRARF